MERVSQRAARGRDSRQRRGARETAGRERRARGQILPRKYTAQKRAKKQAARTHAPYPLSNRSPIVPLALAAWAWCVPATGASRPVLSAVSASSSTVCSACERRGDQRVVWAGRGTARGRRRARRAGDGEAGEAGAETSKTGKARTLIWSLCPCTDGAPSWSDASRLKPQCYRRRPGFRQETGTHNVCAPA